MTPLDPRNALGEFYLRMAEEVSRLSVKVAKGDDLYLDKVLTRLHRIVREMGLSGREREAAELRAEDGRTLCTWRQTKPSRVFDRERFQKANPELAAAFTVEKPGIRRFVVKG